jgi:DNA topoisomerase-1
MSSNLVIVESPAKARTIEKILGDDFAVMASMGHVRDLPEKKLGISIKDGFKPAYEITSSRRKIIDDLIRVARKADAVYLATDPDREGEAIAWHLAEVLKEHKEDCPFHRVTFHEITRPAVNASFADPHEVDMNLVNAQQARRVLDRLVGYKVSPLLWKRIRNASSAGRVQSVALRLICERQDKIDAFKPEEYWNFLADFADDDKSRAFTAKLQQINGKKVDVNNGETAEECSTDARGATYSVSEVKRQPRKRRPGAPFITSTLQQASSRHLRLNPEQTMRLAQQLYEGIDLDGEPTGLITYMRTDSVNVSREAQNAARDYIKEAFGPEYVPEKPNSFKSKSSAQEAHEAIRPTNPALTPEKIKGHLNDEQLKLYRIIWNRFVASQMAPSDQLLYPIALSSKDGSSKNSYLFRASTTSVTFMGFLKVYNLSDDDENAEPPVSLPDIKQGEALNLAELRAEQKFTEPPPQFTEAMLVRELENNGIGRPSTYASIIRTILDREYVNRAKAKLVPTDMGREVNAYLVDTLPSLFEVDFTARMEDQLDTIEQGDLNWEEMMQDFYGRFADWVHDAKFGSGPEIKDAQKLIDTDPYTVEWAEPTQVGKRKYDDQRFYQSLSDQIGDDKKLSERQWNALLRITTRYAKQIPGLDATLADLGLEEQFEEMRQAAASREVGEGGDPLTDRMVALLSTVDNWEEPVKRGRRTYDDAKFHLSLKQQAEAGRRLSPAQIRALKQLLVKYRDQIADFEKVNAELDLPIAEAGDSNREAIERMLAIGEKVSEWDEPSGKGRRRFDPADFYDSLKSQYKQRGTLSDRQVAALGKLLVKHSEKVENFEALTDGLDLPQSSGGTKVITEIQCPKCESANLAERQYRNNTFYGCSSYPKCKYSSKTLDPLDPVK